MIDTNGDFTEVRLEKLPTKPSVAAVAMAACSLGSAGQIAFVADSDGIVRPLAVQPPGSNWSWKDPIAQHDNIRGLAAYFHAGDGRLHCFIAQENGAIWECAFASPANFASLRELQLGENLRFARP